MLISKALTYWSSLIQMLSRIMRQDQGSFTVSFRVLPVKNILVVFYHYRIRTSRPFKDSLCLGILKGSLFHIYIVKKSTPHTHILSQGPFLTRSYPCRAEIPLHADAT